MARKSMRFNHSFTQQSFMNANSIQYFVKWQRYDCDFKKNGYLGRSPFVEFHVSYQMTFNESRFTPNSCPASKYLIRYRMCLLMGSPPPPIISDICSIVWDSPSFPLWGVLLLALQTSMFNRWRVCNIWIPNYLWNLVLKVKVFNRLSLPKDT